MGGMGSPLGVWGGSLNRKGLLRDIHAGLPALRLVDTTMPRVGSKMRFHIITDGFLPTGCSRPFSPCAVFDPASGSIDPKNKGLGLDLLYSMTIECN